MASRGAVAVNSPDPGCRTLRDRIPVFACVTLVGFAAANPTLSVAIAEDSIPVAGFARLPAFESPMISPDGRHVAVTMSGNGRRVVVVRSVDAIRGATQDEPAVIGSGSNFINWYDWANDDRLVFSIRTSATEVGRGGSFMVGLARLGSVGRDASKLVMFDAEPNIHGFYHPNPAVVSWLRDDPDHVLASINGSEREWNSPRVHRVNVYNGEATLVQRNRWGVQRWIADENGDIRVGVKIDSHLRKRKSIIYYRDDVEARWEVLQEVDYFDDRRMRAHRFAEENPFVLLVRSSLLLDQLDRDERDEAWFAYDLRDGEIDGLYEDSHRQQVIKTVEKALPGRDVSIVSHDMAKKRYFFRTHSDVVPAEYFLLDLDARRLDYIASEYPAIADLDFSPMQEVEYTARDGHRIPAILTMPRGEKKKGLPVVVYPHGGPRDHDEWGFDNYVQFFAHRGYAVLQPQYRGSTGFGVEHERAGYGQWGQLIQDDITDGVMWLIESGIADPGRICIVGHDFGGYAAIMGAAKNPGLYQCAASINAFLDLLLMFEDSQNYVFDTIMRATWNTPDQMRAVSPYHQAGQIEASILLIASERDTIVPPKHSKRMRKRLRKLGKDVTYVELKGGEHWRSSTPYEVTKLQSIEAFLARSIGDDRPSKRSPSLDSLSQAE